MAAVAVPSGERWLEAMSPAGRKKAQGEEGLAYQDKEVVYQPCYARYDDLADGERRQAVQ